MSVSAEDIKKNGNAFLRCGDFDNAILCYTEAIKLEGSNPVFYFNRCTALLKKKNYIDALNDISRCLELNPFYIKAYHRKSICLENLNSPNESLKWISRGLEIWKVWITGESSPDDVNVKEDGDKYYELLIQQERYIRNIVNEKRRENEQRNRERRREDEQLGRMYNFHVPRHYGRTSRPNEKKNTFKKQNLRNRKRIPRGSRQQHRRGGNQGNKKGKNSKFQNYK